MTDPRKIFSRRVNIDFFEMIRKTEGKHIEHKNHSINTCSETLVVVLAGVPFMVLGVDSSVSALDGVPLRSKGSGEVESP